MVKTTISKPTFDDLSRLLQQITALSDVPDPAILKRLIDALRVTHTQKPEHQKQANANVELLIDVLDKHPEYAVGLAAFTLLLLKQYRQTSLYVDTGITSDQTFSSSFAKLVTHRFLPHLPEEASIVELIDYIFDTRHDEAWLASVDNELWDTLIEKIKVDSQHADLVARAKNNILNAMVILSYRISGIGLHPDLMAAYPEMLDYSAAFVAQNEETVLFVDAYRKSHELDALKDVMPSDPADDIDPAPLLVMIEQCEDIVNTIRKRIYKTGISIRLTNMMLRLEQSLQRLRILSELVSDNHKDRDKAILELTRAIIVSAKRRFSVRYLIDTNTKLLSQKMTENASKVGEHYISTDKSGFKAMFKKAAIGGFIIAFMATLKILAYSLELSPFGRAFVYSMIYGLGFVFIHLVHGTVATKQPAMTAAAIASTISENAGKKSHRLAKLSELIIDIFRTQFIAILGNVLIAMPLAFLISYAWLSYFGTPMIDFGKADNLLHDLNPFTSLALFHAAIAGVFLFLAGLIAGYYDNLAVFNHIGERIARHRVLLKVFSKNATARLGEFVEGNLGAIMGNFLFGVFLGSTGTLGYIFGLPLDIRHIAFSSANFSHGIFNADVSHVTWTVVAISLLGVALIGLINLLVSFSLALMVALRSKDVKFMQWRHLGKLLFEHLMTHPKDFFVPRPEPMQYAQINQHGQMIFDEKSLTNPTKQDKAYHKKYVMRRLSDERVVPVNVAIDKDKIDKFHDAVAESEQLKAEKNGNNGLGLGNLLGNVNNPPTGDATSQSNTPAKKQVVLEEDSEMQAEFDALQLGSTDEAQKEQAKGYNNSQTEHPATTEANMTTTQNDLTSDPISSADVDDVDLDEADLNHPTKPLPKPKKKPQLPE